MQQAAIDEAVKRSVSSGLSLYSVDQPALLATAPNLVITQALCAVCAPATEEVDAVCVDIGRQLRAAGSSTTVEVLSLQPTDLPTVAASFEAVACACGPKFAPRGAALRSEFERKFHAVSAAVASTTVQTVRPSVLLLEWLEPVFDAGHWVPGQIEAACCRPATCGEHRMKSTERSWADVTAADPDCILVGCCGFDAQRNLADARALLKGKGMAAESFRSLRAVQAGRVFAVDANTYFARPSPSLAEGAALVARCAYANEPAVVTALENEIGFSLPPATAWAPVHFEPLDQCPEPLLSRSPPLLLPTASSGGGDGSVRLVEIEDCWKIHQAAVAAGEQYYTDPETGYFVFSEIAHRQRGTCCGNGW